MSILTITRLYQTWNKEIIRLLAKYGNIELLKNPSNSEQGYYNLILFIKIVSFAVLDKL